jgi:ABC-type transporter Mla MlaB component
MGSISFSIRGPIARTDLTGLCDRVCAILERSNAEVALCDVSGIEPDAVIVDALARLQLAAQRHGCQVRLRSASTGLIELVTLMGLEDVLVLELGGHAEQGEDPGRVQEEGELDDSSVRDLEHL